MNDSRLKSVAKQIGMLGVLTIVVAALTLFFNLCGTLSVSVIAGMMTGASRRWKWQAILVSLVFPFVVLALGKVTTVDLDVRQRISLAAVCFGAFWATYLVTFLLMCLEKKSPPSPAQPASRHSTAHQELGSLPQPDEAPANRRIPGVALETSEPKNQLSLHHLQGTWLCETSHPNEPSHKKVFAITQDKFSLSIVNASGHAHLVAQGDVIVQGVASEKSLIISGTSGDEPISLG